MPAAAAVAASATAASLAFAGSNARPIGTGVVVIHTSLALQSGEAAGTGMVLTSNGEILTNNHVIRGATAVRIVIPGSSRSYRGGWPATTSPATSRSSRRAESRA